jgi:hypothetical protein
VSRFLPVNWLNRSLREPTDDDLPFDKAVITEFVLPDSLADFPIGHPYLKVGITDGAGRIWIILCKKYSDPGNLALMKG